VVKAVTYNDSDLVATMSLEPPLRSGEINITFPGITDASMEKNAPEQHVLINFITEEPTAAPLPLTADPIPPVEPEEPISPLVWLLGALVIALIVVGITMSVIKSRGGIVKVDGKLRFAGNHKEEVYISEEEVEAAQYKFITTKPAEISLRVIDGTGKSRDICLPVQGSLFIGRASGNDLVFDDKRMSRQHFAIEAKDGSFIIQNLSQTSGTLLNGVTINAPRPLMSGDRIEAGKVVFIVI